MKKNVYLYGSGELKRKDNTLAFISDKGAEYIPVVQVDKVYVFGETKITRKTTEFLNANSISVYYFTRFGNYIGRFVPKNRKMPKTIINQVRMYDNVNSRNKIIMEIEKGIILNNLSLLKYYFHRKGIVQIEGSINAVTSELNNLKGLNIEDFAFADKALLIEARVKENYYHIFDSIIKDPDFEFKKRISNPPGNYLNAMLSFGYALLYSDLLSYIDGSDLLAEISFIHGHIKHKNGALHYDLADLFKPYYIDRLCINMILNKKITSEHFYCCRDSGGYFLNEEGRKVFTLNYDHLLSKTITDSRNSHIYSYKQLLKREVMLIESYINGDQLQFKAANFKW